MKMKPTELNKTEIRILRRMLGRVRFAEEERMQRAEKNPHVFKASVMKLKMIRYARAIRSIDYIESLFK